MNLSNYFEQLLARQNLSTADMRHLMKQCILGDLTDAQIASFLVLMRSKGETTEELTAAAQVLLELAHPIHLGDELVDIVGTGGDGRHTFNISTVSSFVASAAGVKIAKHGNRSVSSSSGSADVLLTAGIQLEMSDAALQKCMQEYHLCFLFAPHFHQALQKVRSARQQLGIRTFFNLLGPLINPAKPKKQVVGVYQKQLQRSLAEVLVNLGSERLLIITSRDGLDEISFAAETDILEYSNGHFHEWTINPSFFGMNYHNLDSIIVSSPKESYDLMLAVLQGEKLPARDIVILNSAAAIYINDLGRDYAHAIELATEALDNGAALAQLTHLQQFSQHLSLNK